MSTKYNESPFYYKRRPTREVKVGEVGIGGKNPIRIQSMITSNTRDTEESIKQISELVKVGCEIVRLTVPSQADADNLPNIRKRMKDLGLKVPLVADIHFTPQVALKCLDWVEKVRINPGNFADKKKFDIIEYSDQEYEEELERIEEVFTPLVLRAKELGVSMRIGTNHGSLSDRIMNRFGDTALGMVESALEFIKIAERNSYQDIVVSMKASNPQVMIQAYRLLVSRFYELGMDYPLHLGVTEAGDGTDGRIKSAIGIGALLEDGLGDTIRVSLTEDAVFEIPVAKALVEKYNHLWLENAKISDSQIQTPKNENQIREKPILSEFRDPYQYSRFYSRETKTGDLNLGDHHSVKVETTYPFYGEDTADRILNDLQTNAKSGRIPDIIHFKIDSEMDLLASAQMTKKGKFPLPVSITLSDALLADYESYLEDLYSFQKWNLNPLKFYLDSEESFSAILDIVTRFAKDKRSIEWKLPASELNFVPILFKESKKRGIQNLFFSLENANLMEIRTLAYYLRESDFPIVLNAEGKNFDSLLNFSSIQLGGSLLDGIGDLLRIDYEESPVESLHLSFDILQATRLRLTKTEYISCPSCGRTMFDLQSTTAKIKEKTGHLKGVKIAVMGCIVNGPGEMADADFGYVGAGVGKVHLYKGKEIVRKGVSESEAADQLIELIRENGMWTDPE